MQKEPYIIILDVETTGLPLLSWQSYKKTDNWPFIVQIAWIKSCVNYPHIFEEFDIILKPDGFIISKDSENIHRISQERALSEGIERLVGLKQFAKHVEGADYIVAHNAEFDINVIRCELFRNNIKDALESKEVVCTMIESTEFCAIPASQYNDEWEFSDQENFKWPKLSELYYILFGRHFDRYHISHNAKYDALATYYCFWGLIAKDIITPKNRHKHLSYTKEQIKRYNDEYPKKPDRLASEATKKKHTSVMVYRRGREKETKGDFEGAASDYREMLRMALYREDYRGHSNYQLTVVVALHSWAECLFKIGRYDAALERYSLAIQMPLDPGRFNVNYENTAYCRYKLKDYYGALLDVFLAIRSNPNRKDPYLINALIHKKIGNYALAIESLNTATATKPNELKKGKNEKKKSYKARLKPFKKAYKLRSNCYKKIGDYENAQYDLDRVAELKNKF